MNTSDNNKLNSENFSKQEKTVEVRAKQSITTATANPPVMQPQTNIQKDNKK